jgi:transcription-repair coupling factor (superfamily II helicase)
MKDLEIRGAGNLLGVEQSGNIAAVGFNYYCQLLAEAVEEIKAGRSGIEIREKPEQPQVSIDLKLSAYIPEGYIENTRTRFNFYQRLAKCDTLQYVQTLREEMIDRFGPLPEEVVNLLFIVEMKIMAIKTGVEFIYRDDNELVISYKEDLKYGDISLPSSTKSVYKIGNKQIRIDLDKAADRWQDLLRLLLENVSRVPA